MSEFLDRVQKASDLRDHDRALEAVRGVYYALFVGTGDEGAREAAGHLPEDLETLWKPALFARLREDAFTGGPGGDGAGPPDREAFVARVRRHAPALEEDAVERVTRAVLRELRPHLSADGRSALAPGLPDQLRNDWTG